MVAGQSGARSVFRISAMFSTEYGTPYSWPLKVMPLTASGSNIDVSGIVTGSMALFWTKLPITSCAQTTMSGPVPCWLAVMNWVSRFSEMASTSTVTPLSVAHCSANGLIAAARLSSAQIDELRGAGAGGRGLLTARRRTPPRTARPRSRPLSPGRPSSPDPPLEHAATKIAISASRIPNRLITLLEPPPENGSWDSSALVHRLLSCGRYAASLMRIRGAPTNGRSRVRMAPALGCLRMRSRDASSAGSGARAPGRWSRGRPGASPGGPPPAAGRGPRSSPAGGAPRLALVRGSAGARWSAAGSCAG